MLSSFFKFPFLDEYFLRRPKLKSVEDCISETKKLREEVIEYTKMADRNESLLSAVTRLDSIYNGRFDRLESNINDIKKDIDWLKIILVKRDS